MALPVHLVGIALVSQRSRIPILLNSVFYFKLVSVLLNRNCCCCFRGNATLDLAAVRTRVLYDIVYRSMFNLTYMACMITEREFVYSEFGKAERCLL